MRRIVSISLVLVAAATAAFPLSGCGGGSSEATVQEEGAPTTPDPEGHAQAVEEVNASQNSPPSSGGHGG